MLTLSSHYFHPPKSSAMKEEEERKVRAEEEIARQKKAQQDALIRGVLDSHKQKMYRSKLLLANDVNDICPPIIGMPSCACVSMRVCVGACACELVLVCLCAYMCLCAWLVCLSACTLVCLLVVTRW